MGYSVSDVEVGAACGTLTILLSVFCQYTIEIKLYSPIKGEKWVLDKYVLGFITLTSSSLFLQPYPSHTPPTD